MSTDSIDPSIVEAVRKIEHFIEQTTGKRATQQQIARALARYFVLNEIKEHIVLEWEGGAG